VTGDSERARDAVQEAFATAVRKRGSFRREGPLEAWVWRIVLNAARSDVRRGIPTVGYDEATAANGQPERDAELRVASRACRSGNGSPSSSGTTRTSPPA
jgi:DNA-directed RNA polymerase specialized sigma24 family protein